MNIRDRLMDIQNRIGNAIDTPTAYGKILNELWAELNIVISHIINEEE